jgi:hypothetical protein
MPFMIDSNVLIDVSRGNAGAIQYVEPHGKDSRVAIFADGTKVPVSRAGHERLKVLLDEKVTPARDRPV